MDHNISIQGIQVGEWLTSIGASYLLIFVAEFGDKSQLVCMTLAARHRAWPVIFGAITAFAILNILAVSFGAALALWIPGYILAVIVCLLFTIFGLHALMMDDSSEDSDKVAVKSNHSLFITTFLLISIAEFGDKTQLAVAALSSTNLAAAVWVGATLALASTTILGVVAGKTLLKKLSLTLLHRLSGLVFIVLAGFAAYKAYLDF